MENTPWDEDHPDFHLDAEEFFGEDPTADIQHWSKAAYWTAEEAAALSYGYDPRLVNMNSLKGRAHPFVRSYNARRDLVLRAQRTQQLQENIQPEEFIRWTNSNGLSFYDELKNAVSDKVLSRDKEPKPDADESLNPKVKQSLQKLALGLAAAGYGYVPGQARNRAHQEIKNELDRVGISLDVDTIRKRLSEAGEEFGHLVQLSDKDP